MKQSNWIRHIGTYLVVNVVAVAMLMLFAGVVPKTRIGWAILLLLGFPLWLLGEYMVGENLLSKRVSDAIDPSPKPVSIFRMQYALFIILLVIVIETAIYYIYKDFWHQHFTFY